MTFDETLSGIRESIVRYAREGRLGLLGDSLTAYERVVAGEMLLRPAQPQENVEGQKTPTNSDYAAALKVFNEWFFNYRGASHDTGDFCEWLDKRLHSSTNVA